VICGTINEDPCPLSGILQGHDYSLFNTEKISDIQILLLNNPYGQNNPNEMQYFKLDLRDKFIEEQIKDYNTNYFSWNYGNFKIDFVNFLKHFDRIEICRFINLEVMKII
jgi:hypothetical protein